MTNKGEVQRVESSGCIPTKKKGGFKVKYPGDYGVFSKIDSKSAYWVAFLS